MQLVNLQPEKVQTMFFTLNGFGDLIIFIVVVVVILAIVGKDDKGGHDDGSVRTFHRPGHDKDWQ